MYHLFYEGEKKRREGNVTDKKLIEMCSHSWYITLYIRISIRWKYDVEVYEVILFFKKQKKNRRVETVPRALLWGYY